MILKLCSAPSPVLSTWKTEDISGESMAEKEEGDGRERRKRHKRGKGQGGAGGREAGGGMGRE